MDVNKLVEVLEAYFPLSLQEGWDNSGLQISPEDSSIKGVLLSLDVGIKTVEEAINNNCNLIIAHHPLLFSAAKKIYNHFYPYNIVHKAIKNGIGIYAYHTNLDIANGGLNDYICNMLKLTNIKVVEKHPPLRIGELPEAMSLYDTVSCIKKTLDIECVKFVKGNDKPIKKIAVCTGSCSDMIYDILDEDFDTFLSGDLKHHTAYFARETKLNIIDATHFHTEKFAKQILAEILSQNIDGLRVFISKTDTIPWLYK